MSSALGLWKVNSSSRTVTSVNVCANALLLLKRGWKNKGVNEENEIALIKIDFGAVRM